MTMTYLEEAAEQLRNAAADTANLTGERIGR
jgi:hypothetical protein